jgi:type IV pilus assembly protein PilB
MGIEPFLVGSSIDCVMAQRLARRLCDWCKEGYSPTESELAAARWPMQELGVPEQLWKAVGCRSCAQTGFRGRLALSEVMPVTEELERLTVERSSASALMKVALAEGMTTLHDDGARKTALGFTTLEETLRVTI